jgi:septal ring factor EnvC (AmiA/AmiB activator)
MKLSVKELRTIVREEYMRGVPEFMLQDASRKYVDEIKNNVKRHIQEVTSSPDEAREAFDKLDAVFKELETDVNQLMENRIWQFLQHI